MICAIRRNELSSIRLLITLFTVCRCLAWPVNRIKKLNDYSEVMDFLIRFNYIPNEDLHSNALRNEDYFRDAVKKMQEYGGIKITGYVDDDTLALLKKPRCGNPDFNDSKRKKQYIYRGEKWPKYDITWKQTADIEVKWVRGDHGDAMPFSDPDRNSTLAHAFYPGPDEGGDVHFDNDRYWVEEPTALEVASMIKYHKIFPAAAHEFGHSIGLGHELVFEALMNPYYKDNIDPTTFTLPDDDKAGLHFIYGPKRGSGAWTPDPPDNIPTIPSRKPTSKHPTLPPGSASKPKEKPKEKDKLDVCTTNFDAIASIRNEMFFFKGKYFWRLIDDDFRLERADPIETKRFFEFPRDVNFEQIDAVYERTSSRKVIFFIGDEFYQFDSTKLERGYPKKIQELGLPDDVKKIDAAMVWSLNDKTYFFAGNKYWRFDEKKQKVEFDYPRDMSVWKGIPTHVDTAFGSAIDSLTYFTKGNKFYRLRNLKMTVQSGPTLIGPVFFGSHCR